MFAFNVRVSTRQGCVPVSYVDRLICGSPRELQHRRGTKSSAKVFRVLIFTFAAGLRRAKNLPRSEPFISHPEIQPAVGDAGN